MQHQPFQLGHLGVLDHVIGLEVMQRAEHPADRVAQFAVGLDGVLEDFRPDALVVGIVGDADPQPQNIGPGLRHHFLRLDGVAKRLRHLAAVLIEREAMRQHDVIGRAAPGAAAFQERGVKPAAVLVASFQIHHGVGSAIDLALDAGKARKMHRVFQHESVRRAGIEPDVADVVDLLPVFVGARAEEPFAGAVHIPGVGAFRLKGIRDALVDGVIAEDFGRAVALLAHEHRNGHAPGALARDHPVGATLDHAVDAVLARGRHPLRHRDRVQGADAKGVAGFGLALVRDRLIHRDEPLRRVAKDHRLLGAPGMRVLMV